MTNKKFSVKSFIWEEDKESKIPTRKVIELGKDLEWKDAKKLCRENKGSWIV
jgi:hypothetical protein